MKILITGLCLSRNLGGAAMGLTLIDALKKRLGEDLEFRFTVDATSFGEESKAAQKYGVPIAKSAFLSTYLSHFFLTRYISRALKRKNLSYLKNAFRFWQETFNDHIKAYKDSDIIIDMSGISYVGDGTRDIWEGLNSFTPFFLAKIARKPFVRFIQSYGPLERFDVRFFAGVEFRYLERIYSRGKASASECEKIVDSKKVFDYPDCAILLPKASDEWLTSYLKGKNLIFNDYVILSPSAVTYNIPPSVAKCSKEEYVALFANIAKRLIESGEKILFLPHMYSSDKRECDREIAKKVLALLPQGACELVEEDIDPMEAKALISASKYAVVSRYHALVAALSSGVKVVTLGWNIKYEDLLAYYGLESKALDIRRESKETLLEAVFAKLAEYEAESHIKDYAAMQDAAKVRVEEGFDALAEFVRSAVCEKERNIVQ